MTPEMHEALLASIEHWKENLALGVVDAKIVGRDCPLCNLTRSNPEAGVDCRQCPVMRKTGEWDCEGSPWGDVAEARWAADKDAFNYAAQREIAFLESLLPESETPDAQ